MPVEGNVLTGKYAEPDYGSSAARLAESNVSASKLWKRYGEIRPPRIPMPAFTTAHKGEAKDTSLS
jgi:hypothetical protein